MLVVIFAEILHHRFIRTIYNNFKSGFCLSSANENFETCIQVWFVQLEELKQFWGTFT